MVQVDSNSGDTCPLGTSDCDLNLKFETYLWVEFYSIENKPAIGKATSLTQLQILRLQ